VLTSASGLEGDPLGLLFANGSKLHCKVSCFEVGNLRSIALAASVIALLFAGCGDDPVMVSQTPVLAPDECPENIFDQPRPPCTGNDSCFVPDREQTDFPDCTLGWRFDCEDGRWSEIYEPETDCFPPQVADLEPDAGPDSGSNPETPQSDLPDADADIASCLVSPCEEDDFCTVHEALPASPACSLERIFYCSDGQWYQDSVSVSGDDLVCEYLNPEDCPENILDEPAPMCSSGARCFLSDPEETAYPGCDLGWWFDCENGLWVEWGYEPRSDCFTEEQPDSGLDSGLSDSGVFDASDAADAG